MGTINYQFSPNDYVYLIQKCKDEGIRVNFGTVIQVRTYTLNTSGSPSLNTKVFYDIRLTNGGTGTFPFEESDVFASLALVMAEYEIRVLL